MNASALISIRSLVFTVVACALVGCEIVDVRTESAEVTPDAQVYRLDEDEQVLVRVTNTSSGALYYDACRRPTVDVFEDGAFVRNVSFLECRAIIPTRLEAGETLTFEIRLGVLLEMARVHDRDQGIHYIADYVLYRDSSLESPLPRHSLKREPFRVLWGEDTE